MHRVVISGVTGHLGRELALQLAQADIEVHGLTRQAAATSFPEITNIHRIDGRTEPLVTLFQQIKPTAVIHLAALARREHRLEDIAAFNHTNILFGTQLLEAARQSDCYSFITAGSYLQYSATGEYRPFNLYSATKQAFECVLRYYVDACEFAASVLTLCNVYGELDPRPTLITDMAAACSQRRSITMHGAEAWIDPIHVSDAASAFVQALLLMNDSAAHTGDLRHYSVTCGRDVSSSELAMLFERITGHSLSIDGDNKRASRRLKPWRGALVPGWTPRVSLEEGLARVLRHQFK
ncbi:NAD-dependent epimerase/dehydratase family protein [Steroidobacter flavus]|uniref:NAD-dependent epimerase/dehydratase family protein n=1 Tax=Steroidobacter flavus TaxID=1842136 RepID=A0ABV8T3A5_9GAMM